MKSALPSSKLAEVAKPKWPSRDRVGLFLFNILVKLIDLLFSFSDAANLEEVEVEWTEFDPDEAVVEIGKWFCGGFSFELY